jgi:hypothetical protein
VIYSGVLITKKGRELIAKSQATSSQTVLKYLALGAGTAKLTEESVQLTDKRQQFEFDSVKQAADDATEIILQASPNNIDLKEGYDIREMGIFAEDPDEGDVLYAVINTEDGAQDYDKLPQYRSSGDYKEIIFSMQITVADAENVEFDLSPESLRRQVMQNTEGIAAAQIAIEENNQYARTAISNVQYDLEEVAFQLAIRDLIDDSKLRNVIVDEIDSADAVTLTSGSYADGKVYI